MLTRHPACAKGKASAGGQLHGNMAEGRTRGLDQCPPKSKEASPESMAVFKSLQGLGRLQASPDSALERRVGRESLPPTPLCANEGNVAIPRGPAEPAAPYCQPQLRRIDESLWCLTPTCTGRQRDQDAEILCMIAHTSQKESKRRSVVGGDGGGKCTLVRCRGAHERGLRVHHASRAVVKRGEGWRRASSKSETRETAAGRRFGRP